MTRKLTRAFLALEVPAAIKERLAAAQENLRRELPRARWTRPDGWHLTLKFLGEVAAPALDGLGARRAGRRACPGGSQPRHGQRAPRWFGILSLAGPAAGCVGGRRRRRCGIGCRGSRASGRGHRLPSRTPAVVHSRDPGPSQGSLASSGSRSIPRVGRGARSRAFRLPGNRALQKRSPTRGCGVHCAGKAAPSPVFSPGFVARAAKGSQMLGFSRIGRRRRSHTTPRSTIYEKHDRWLPFAARSRHPVGRPG